MRLVVPLAVAAACAACSVDRAAPAPARPPAGFDCATLVPARYRPAALGVVERRIAPRLLACAAAAGEAGQEVFPLDRMAWRVTVDCRATAAVPAFDRRDEHRYAYALPRGGCVVDVTTGRGWRARDIAKAVAGRLEGAAVPPPAPAAFDLRCDRLVPAAVRARFLAGAVESASSRLPDTLECAYHLPAAGVVAKYDCLHGRLDADTVAEALRDLDASVARLPLADGGLLVSDSGAHTVVFRDPDVPCTVHVTVQGRDAGAAVDVATALERALTRESAGATRAAAR